MSTIETPTAYLTEIGRRGGKRKTERKRLAMAGNLEKARAAKKKKRHLEQAGIDKSETV